VRGGAYVYLPDKPAIEAAFDEDFDYLVTPVAYDFEAHIDPNSGWRFVDAVGAALDDGAADNGVAGVDFGASTLFLSGGGGGIAIVLEREGTDASVPAAGEALARFDLRYVTADDASEVVDELELAFQGGTAWRSTGLGAESPLADDLGVYKMTLLLDEVDALTAAGMYCAGSMPRAGAVQAAQEAARRLAVVGDELEDAPLSAESALMDRLAENLSERQPHCW
jgi:Ca-activated chloride channel family protein